MEYVPLTNGDLERALGVSADDVIVYSKLKEYASIDELLPEPYDFRIILIEETQNKGHWVALMRQDATYVYFNSYGHKYDKDLYMVSRIMRRILGQESNEIGRLLAGKHVVYNKVKYQGDKTSTCGRWVVLAVEMMTKLGYSLDQFHEFMRKHKKRGETFDALVCRFVPIQSTA